MPGPPERHAHRVLTHGRQLSQPRDHHRARLIDACRLVTKRSQVVRCDLSPYTVRSQRVRGREGLLKFVMSRLQAVTSLSAVGAADTIDLTVGIDLDAPDTCDTKVKSRRPSTGLVAHVSRPVPLLGCYHGHLAGLGHRDVYVVEVTTESQSFWNSRVTVNLLPMPDRKSTAGNLTLILKSAVPVTWELASDGFSGDLLVLTERPVKETRLGSDVAVETRFTRLPGSFTALMLFAVKYSHGPPVAYVRAAAFNELDIRLNGGAALAEV
ncbi:Transforming growth factor beta receptor type 3 [Amphibalanus amphitrite]|uniref:Transforming growth factor beta receptor type 3 n=1 Tax=Amphibalanus amphitrite TaxID=1232801 RepID=A0A6A4VGX6_AMPAM|nr:Transforming growth factor beta receptor type 3 [Amphibalanus amphitrite]